MLDRAPGGGSRSGLESLSEHDTDLLDCLLGQVLGGVVARAATPRAKAFEVERPTVLVGQG